MGADSGAFSLLFPSSSLVPTPCDPPRAYTEWSPRRPRVRAHSCVYGKAPEHHPGDVAASSVAGAPYPPNWGGGGYGGGPLSCTRVTRPPAQRTSGTLYGRATRRLPLVGCAPLPPRGMVEGAAGRAPLGGKGSDRTGRALGPVENSTASGPSRAPTMATRQPPQKGGSAGPPFAQREPRQGHAVLGETTQHGSTLPAARQDR
jgi:hypothetical protein